MGPSPVPATSRAVVALLALMLATSSPQEARAQQTPPPAGFSTIGELRTWEGGGALRESNGRRWSVGCVGEATWHPLARSGSRRATSPASQLYALCVGGCVVS